MILIVSIVMAIIIIVIAWVDHFKKVALIKQWRKNGIPFEVRKQWINSHNIGTYIKAGFLFVVWLISVMVMINTM